MSMDRTKSSRRSGAAGEENIPIHERLSKAKPARTAGALPSSSPTKSESPVPPPKNTRPTSRTDAVGSNGKIAAPKLSAATLRRLAGSQDKSGASSNTAPPKSSPPKTATSNSTSLNASKARSTPSTASKAQTSTSSARSATTRRLPTVQTTPTPARNTEQHIDVGSEEDDETPMPTNQIGDDAPTSSPASTAPQEYVDNVNFNEIRENHAKELEALKISHAQERGQLEGALVEIEERHKVELKAAKDRCTSAEEEAKNLQSRCSELAKESARRIEVIDRLYREVSELNNDIRDLSATKARNNALHQEQDQLMEKVSHRENQIVELERDLDNFHQKHARALADKETLETTVSRLESDKKSLAADMEKNRQELEIELKAAKATTEETLKEREQLTRTHEEANALKQQGEKRLQDQLQASLVELEKARQEKRDAVEEKRVFERDLQKEKQFIDNLRLDHQRNTQDLRVSLAEAQRELDDAHDQAYGEEDKDFDAVKEFMFDFLNKLGLKDGFEDEDDDFDAHDAHHRIFKKIDSLMEQKDKAVSSANDAQERADREAERANILRGYMNQCLCELGCVAKDAESLDVERAQRILVALIEHDAAEKGQLRARLSPLEDQARLSHFQKMPAEVARKKVIDHLLTGDFAFGKKILEGSNVARSNSQERDMTNDAQPANGHVDRSALPESSSMGDQKGKSTAQISPEREKPTKEDVNLFKEAMENLVSHTEYAGPAEEAEDGTLEDEQPIIVQFESHESIVDGFGCHNSESTTTRPKLPSWLPSQDNEDAVSAKTDFLFSRLAKQLTDALELNSRDYNEH